VTTWSIGKWLPNVGLLLAHRATEAFLDEIDA
jgi:hypothetical protein